MRILIADDDPQLLRALRITLAAKGYEVIIAGDGAEAVSAAVDRRPDLVMLDLGMPRLDGMQVIQALRGWTEVPILVVSGRADAADKVEALDSGADDYITKPFSVDELLARVRALTRRRSRDADGPEEAIVRLGRITVSLASHEVVDDAGSRIRLTPTEWLVLEQLIRGTGRLVTRQELLTRIWDTDKVRDTGYLRLYLSQLRKKLELDPSNPRYLITEPGMGYRLRFDEPLSPPRPGSREPGRSRSAPESPDG